MDILQYVAQEGLVMIPVLFIIGKFIKETDVFADKWIPLILLTIGIGFTPLLLGGFTPDTIVQGVLVTGATVLGDQLVKQSKKEE